MTPFVWCQQRNRTNFSIYCPMFCRYLPAFLKNKRMDTMLPWLFVLVIPDIWIHLGLFLYSYCKNVERTVKATRPLKGPHKLECKRNFWNEIHWFEKIALWIIIKENVKFRKQQLSPFRSRLPKCLHVLWWMALMTDHRLGRSHCCLETDRHFVWTMHRRDVIMDRLRAKVTRCGGPTFDQSRIRTNLGPRR